jgi:hypothetical protein
LPYFRASSLGTYSATRYIILIIIIKKKKTYLTNSLSFTRPLNHFTHPHFFPSQLEPEAKLAEPELVPEPKSEPPEATDADPKPKEPKQSSI